MKELFTNFSVNQIILFIVLLAAAIKGAVSWIEWAVKKLKDKFGKEEKISKQREQIREDLDEIKDAQLEITKAIQMLSGKVSLLMDSDRDDIKAWITEKHHYYCYELGYIDDYNLDCIEKRYKHYEDEGGNSFVHDLMDEIRKLPKAGTTRLYNEENNNKE